MKKELDIKQVLEALSKEKLIDIILDVTENNDVLKNRIIFKYSKGDNKEEIKKCKKLINLIVKEYVDESGFVRYEHACDFMQSMEEILERAREEEDVMLAFDISLLLLNEIIEAFKYSHYSSGDIGYLIANTMEFISKDIVIRDDLNLSLRKQVFNKLIELINNNVFHDFEDYRNDILQICSKFADISELRYKLVRKINDLISKDPDNRYHNEIMLQILFEIVKKYGTKEESEKFIKDNLEFTYFREMLIHKYMEQKNYGEIVQLTLEGEKKDRNYVDLEDKWKKIRYTVYKKLQNKEEQEKLAKELLFHGNFEYYRELKELNKENTKEFYNNLKKEIKNNGKMYIGKIYVRIILQENDLDELMEFVRNNHRDIELYANRLVGKFSDEVIDIYCKYIKEKASYSFNRSEYRYVCEMLKKYKKIAGKEKQMQLKNQLSDLYKKRPAFVDELSKFR
ncbi:hypothetical protein [Clostridium hydrogenum]|uniref:hypothetical protein n=1 Tax=Clostridium hydrogenum TaxID=2855764 RepID=UPI001F3057A2|nr:hypothetical protein [Clostridium hydrogenum]